MAVRGLRLLFPWDLAYSIRMDSADTGLREQLVVGKVGVDTANTPACAASGTSRGVAAGRRKPAGAQHPLDAKAFCAFAPSPRFRGVKAALTTTEQWVRQRLRSIRWSHGPDAVYVAVGTIHRDMALGHAG